MPFLLETLRTIKERISFKLFDGAASIESGWTNTQYKMINAFMQLVPNLLAY
jgi:hypothetical protein|tara:strand:+ start:1916 stop:2071 length:156 start_codon:yes stop_codon:yes gene_type:complete